MSENNDKVLKQLICPVCHAYPDQEVFQCKNGHPICSSCVPRLKICPICQVPFEVPPIRCRVMEWWLDTVPLPCDNKGAGCTQLFSWKELADHHKICESRSVSLCKWMGYECNFTASTVAPLIQHLEVDHNVQRWDNITYSNFPHFASDSSLYLQECSDDLDPQSSRKTWVLLLAKISFEPRTGQKLFSCVPIHLHDGPCSAQYQVDLQVSVDQDDRIGIVSKWTGFPSNYKDAEEDILLPSFRLSNNYIMKQALKFSQLTEFDLGLEISVAVKPNPPLPENIDSQEKEKCVM